MQNYEILNNIRDNASENYRSFIQELKEGDQIGTDLLTIGSIKKEFLGALLGKITKTVINNKLYDSKFSAFYRGELEYGPAVENIYIDNTEVINNSEHFINSNTDLKNDVTDLYGTAAFKANNTVMEKNIFYNARVSISEAQLKTALLNAEGLQKLIDKMCIAAITSMNFKFEQDMTKMLENIAIKKDLEGNDLENIKDIKIETSEDILKNTTTGYPVGGKLLRYKVDELNEAFTLLNNDYNMQGVFNYSYDNIFLTTPNIYARVDTNPYKLSIKSLPLSYKKGTLNTICVPLGIVLSSNMIKDYSSIDMVSYSFNPNNLTYNIFFKKTGVMALDLNENMALIIENTEVL